MRLALICSASRSVSLLCCFSGLVFGWVCRYKSNFFNFRSYLSFPFSSLQLLYQYTRRKVCLLFSVALPSYFPIQKLEKIFPNKSSELTVPVISARLIWACFRSSATSSPALLPVNWFKALATNS